jgi:hypothetical protein
MPSASAVLAGSIDVIGLNAKHWKRFAGSLPTLDKLIFE